MIAVFFVMLTGIGLGVVLRRVPLIKHIGKVIMLMIFLLLFLLGREVGADERILSNLSSLGVQALLMTIGAVGGSVVCAKFVYRVFFKKA